MTGKSIIARARRDFHDFLWTHVMWVKGKSYPSNADKDSETSKKIAERVASKIGQNLGYWCTGRIRHPEPHRTTAGAGQSLGKLFEEAVCKFLEATVACLPCCRGRNMQIARGKMLTEFEQFKHLRTLEDKAKHDPAVAASLGTGYLIRSDVTVFLERGQPASEARAAGVINGTVARHSWLGEDEQVGPILHASVSCKWTIRSDRAQNARAEALSLIRHRKGRVPHIAITTGEPLPTRIASLALGTGDVDCVYHFALYELQEALDELQSEGNYAEQAEMLKTMVAGARLKDISDLPIDLVL